MERQMKLEPRSKLESRLKRAHSKFQYYSPSLLKTSKYLKQMTNHVNFPLSESTQTTFKYQAAKFRPYSK